MIAPHFGLSFLSYPSFAALSLYDSWANFCLISWCYALFLPLPDRYKTKWDVARHGLLCRLRVILRFWLMRKEVQLCIMRLCLWRWLCQPFVGGFPTHWRVSNKLTIQHILNSYVIELQLPAVVMLTLNLSAVKYRYVWKSSVCHSSNISSPLELWLTFIADLISIVRYNVLELSPYLVLLFYLSFRILNNGLHWRVHNK